jgi:hypothetical protein
MKRSLGSQKNRSWLFEIISLFSNAQNGTTDVLRQMFLGLPVLPSLQPK